MLFIHVFLNFYKYKPNICVTKNLTNGNMHLDLLRGRYIMEDF